MLDPPFRNYLYWVSTPDLLLIFGEFEVSNTKCTSQMPCEKERANLQARSTKMRPPSPKLAKSVSVLLERGLVPSGIVVWRIRQRRILASYLFTTLDIRLLLLASKTTEESTTSLFGFDIMVRSSRASSTVLHLSTLPCWRLCALSSRGTCCVLGWRTVFCPHLTIKLIRV